MSSEESRQGECASARGSVQAVLLPGEVRFEPLGHDSLEAILAVEQVAYAQPWSPRHFVDSILAGYQAQMLLADDILLGYFVAMKGVDEVHLLNITVAPPYQGQGWARIMLEALALWARGQRTHWLWLEVRVGNARAIQVYEAYGFRRVGERKDYYPAGRGLPRESAWVMNLRL